MSHPLLTRPFLLLCCQFLAVCTVAVLFFPLQGYLLSLQMPAGSVGFMLGVDSLAALVVQPFCTPFITTRTARYWLLGGVSVLTVALLIEGNASGTVVFAAARMLHGAGFICVVAALMPLFVLCIPPEMSGRAFGWISLVRLIPYAIIPPLFDLLLRSPAGLGQVIRWSALLAVIVGLLLFWLPRFPQEDQAAGTASFAGVRQSLADYRVLLLLMATVLVYAGYSTVFFYLKGFSRQTGIAGSGLFFTVATLMMIAIRLGAGMLFDRFDKRVMIVVSLLLTAVAAGVLPLLGSTVTLLAIAVCCGLGWGVTMPLVNALLFDVSALELRGLNQNLALLMLQAGFFIGPLLGGWLLSYGGYGALFGMAAISQLLAAVTVFPVRAAHD